MPQFSRNYRLINASIACESITATGISPTAPGYAEIGLETPPQCFIAGGQGIDACFVGETVDNYVVLAFRGTLVSPTIPNDWFQVILDWMQDFQIGPVPWSVNGQSYGNVEGGFARAMTTLWPMLKPALDRIDFSRKAGVWITGHSKGGAMTALAASLFVGAYPSIVPHVMASAPALVGDQAFAENYLRSGLYLTTARYENECDMVPYLPVIFKSDTLRKNPRMATAMAARDLTFQPPQLYQKLGGLNYIRLDPASKTYIIEHSVQGALDGFEALATAITNSEWEKIVRAHNVNGGYLHCFGEGAG
jgi:hypothetical protein